MERKQAGFGIFSTALVALLLIPFIYPAFFAFPEGDDFASAVKAMFLFDFIGGFDQMFSYWWKWSGRYTHAFTLVFFGEACYHRLTYTALILFSFFLLWLAVFGIAKELGKEKSDSQPAFIATFWLFAVLCSYGTIHQWYLLVELVSLIYGYSFTLLYIWSLCRLWNRTNVTRGVTWFPILSCIAASGFYEYSAFLVLIVTAVAWLLAVIYDHPNRKIYFLLLKISAVCFLLVYLARGNFRRQAKRGMTYAMMLEQLLHAGREWWAYVAPAYRNPIYIAALFVAVWLPPRRKAPLTEKISAPLILAGCAVLFLGFSFALTVVHALSDVTVGETGKIPANIAQYSVIFVFFGLYACRDVLRLDALRLDALRFLGRPLSFCLIIAILISGNSNFFPAFWNGVSGEIARYAEAYEKRKAVLAQNKGREVAVMPLFTSPLPIAGDSLAEGFKSWPNKYAAPFYGVKALGATAPDAATAYGIALEEGRVIWSAVDSGIKMAYVPSLDLVKNNTSYRFDWIFIESDGSVASVGVAVFGKNRVADAIVRAPELLRKVSANEWPFKKIFKARPPTRVATPERAVYAVPLPLLDSEISGAAENIFVSIDGRPFVAVSARNSR